MCYSECQNVYIISLKKLHILTNGSYWQLVSVTFWDLYAFGSSPSQIVYMTKYQKQCSLASGKICSKFVDEPLLIMMWKQTLDHSWLTVLRVKLDIISFCEKPSDVTCLSLRLANAALCWLCNWRSCIETRDVYQGYNRWKLHWDNKVCRRICLYRSSCISCP